MFGLEDNSEDNVVELKDLFLNVCILELILINEAIEATRGDVLVARWGGIICKSFHIFQVKVEESVANKDFLINRKMAV